MLSLLVYALIYLGSGLMAYNIYCYIRFARQIRQRGKWEREENLFYAPIFLLILFLIGYLLVALLGKPDLVIAGILSGGSLFVYLMILFVRQVSEKIYEHEHREAALMAAEESSRAKSSFFSTISHEMRTPMNSIIGWGTMAMREPGLPEHVKSHLKKIDESARHLLNLINDVLEMSRIESGQMSVNQEGFELRKMLEQINSIISGQCAEKGLDYRFRLSDCGENYFIGDELKLKQVMINILGNAVKFTPAPGSVELNVEVSPSDQQRYMLRFSVSDTGIGIDPDYLPRIFDAFSQQDSSSTNRFGGSGLGLAISQRFVALMGGNIQVDSSQGAGSTFTVTVMLQRDTAAAVEEAAQSENVSLEGLRVLLAEDMEINAELVSDLLGLEGVEVEWAKNGLQAVNLFEQSKPDYYDAILMDIRMPVMDGLISTRTIRSLSRPDAATIPIIALTANAFEEDVEQALSAGMNVHLSKPVDPDLLYRTLGRLAVKR